MQVNLAQARHTVLCGVAQVGQAMSSETTWLLCTLALGYVQG